jgi:hypothetical protein
MRNFISEDMARQWMLDESPVPKARNVVIGYRDNADSMSAFEAAVERMKPHVFVVTGARIVSQGIERRADMACEHD